jgi:hypothetical protein
MLITSTITDTTSYKIGTWTSQTIENSKIGFPTTTDSSWGYIKWDEENTGGTYDGLVRFDILKASDSSILIGDIVQNTDLSASDITSYVGTNDIKIKTKIYRKYDIPTETLTHYWKFNDATDNIGSADWSQTGGSFVSGLIGNCYDPGGSNTNGLYQTGSRILDGTYSTGTLNFWLKVNSWTLARIYMEYDRDSNGGIFIRQDGTNQALIRLKSPDNLSYDYWDSGLLDGNWHMITITADGTNHKYYQDGVLHKTVTTTQLFKNGSSTWYLLKGYVTGADAEIDEMGFWDRALTADEVKKLYNYGAGIQYPFKTLKEDLIAYYKFDGNANDSVGSHHGTVSGATNGGTATWNTSTKALEFTSGQTMTTDYITKNINYNYFTLQVGSQTGSLLYEITNDNGSTWQTVTLNTRTAFTTSSNLGVKLRVTENNSSTANITNTYDSFGNYVKPGLYLKLEE